MKVFPACHYLLEMQVSLINTYIAYLSFSSQSILILLTSSIWFLAPITTPLISMSLNPLKHEWQLKNNWLDVLDQPSVPVPWKFRVVLLALDGLQQPLPKI